MVSALLGQFLPYIIAAGVALAAIATAYLKGDRAGANREKAKGAQARADNLQDVKRAQDAAAAVRPDDGGMLNDPNNRDRP